MRKTAALTAAISVPPFQAEHASCYRDTLLGKNKLGRGGDVHRDISFMPTDQVSQLAWRCDPTSGAATIALMAATVSRVVA